MSESETAVNETELEGAEAVRSQIAPEQIVPLVQALIFANGDPLSIARLVEVTGLNENEIQNALAIIEAQYASDESGIELVHVAEKYQLRTKPEFSEFVRDLKAEAPRKLSVQALETLAIVAYRQPIVKSDIEKLRGVDAAPTLSTLIDRGLIKIVGHQSSVGQPALYGTTEKFLELFGLGSLGQLPTLRDLKELEDPGEPLMAEIPEGQAADSEPAQAL